MTPTPPAGATIADVTHHVVDLDDTRLHYVAAGDTGSPILLVHGWPETWWAFRAVIPLLAATHRVYAVDLRGFGDSATVGTRFDQATMAADLHHLVQRLGVGPVHLLCQDISGGVGFRFATTHPDNVLSLTAVETTLAGFGLELLADVNGGGSWHVGFLGTPGVPSLLLPGRERELIEHWAYPAMNGTPEAVTEEDLAEFLRTYSRPDAWRGTEGIYHALFTDDGATAALVASHPLRVPVLAVDGANHPTTADTFRRVTGGSVTAVHVTGVGHLVAQEDPAALVAAVLAFTAEVDRG